MFHLFMGQAYYPDGGVNDYCGPFMSIEKAQARAREFVGKRGPNKPWAQIVTIDADYALREIWTLTDSVMTGGIEEWALAEADHPGAKSRT